MDLPYFASVGSIIWWQPGQYVLSRALVNFSSQFGHTTVRRFILASVSHPSEVAGGPRGWAASAPATRVAAREIVRYMKVLMDSTEPIGQTYGSIRPGEPPVSPEFQSCVRKDAKTVYQARWRPGFPRISELHPEGCRDPPPLAWPPLAPSPRLRSRPLSPRPRRSRPDHQN